MIYLPGDSEGYYFFQVHMRFCFAIKYIGPWNIINDMDSFFPMLRINILGFQDNKVEHLIHDMELLTPNSKFLGKLRPKKQYFGCFKQQQF